MRRGWALIGAVALVLTLTPVPAGAASAYQQVLQVYEQQGSVPSCQFTAGQLQAALGGVDTYGAQYFADFSQAVQAALTSRAGGACAAPGGSQAVSAPAVPSSVPPPPSGSLTAAGSGGMPLPLALLGGLALIATVGLGTAATARRVRAAQRDTGAARL
jgi:hypothetical protein